MKHIVPVSLQGPSIATEGKEEEPLEGQRGTVVVTAPSQTSEGSYKWLVLLAIVVGTFVAVLNNVLLNVALPEMMNIFGTTREKIQWIVTIYMLVSGMVIPISGYLGDTWGYKRIYVGALTVFTLGSLLCGMSWNLTSIIAFRALQALGGGMIMPVGMSLIYRAIPRHQIGMALGLWGIAVMVAPAIGPTLGGYLVEYVDWRFLFYLNVPIGTLAIAISLVVLRETDRQTSSRFDLLGCLTSLVAVGSLIWALSEGYNKGWSSFSIVILFVTSLFSFLLFIANELTISEPLLDLRIWKNIAFATSTIVSSLVMMGLFGGMYLTPIFLQTVQGYGTLDTGLILLPQALVMMVMMPVAGKLFDKVGAVPLGLVGLLICGTMTYHLHTLTVDTPKKTLILLLSLRSLGIGLSMMPLITAGMNAVETHLVGRASAMGNVTRQVAGAMSIAILTTILNNRAAFYAEQIRNNISIASDTVVQFIAQLKPVLMTSETTQGPDTMALVLLSGLVQKEALMRAIEDTFLLSSIPFFLAVPLLYFLRRREAGPQIAQKQSESTVPGNNHRPLSNSLEH